MNSAASIRQLTPADVDLMAPWLDMFGRAFEQEDVYGDARPRPDYYRRLLSSESFIALAALAEGEVVGGIAAYELRKFEQERSEVYIYDLAVAAAHRRQGVATAMIEALKAIATERGAWAVFVQADRGDAPAVALYERFAEAEQVLHFDLLPGR